MGVASKKKEKRKESRKAERELSDRRVPGVRLESEDSRKIRSVWLAIRVENGGFAEAKLPQVYVGLLS
jgi:hypothetical protein